jgi:hypothetical protein
MEPPHNLEKIRACPSFMAQDEGSKAGAEYCFMKQSRRDERAAA